MEDAKFYQDLTFERLSELIKQEAKKGNSKLYLPTNHLSYNMIRYLEDRGFVIIKGSTYNGENKLLDAICW